MGWGECRHGKIGFCYDCGNIPEDDVEVLKKRIAELEAENKALRAIRQTGCECGDEDACRFACERDEAIRLVRLLSNGCAFQCEWEGKHPKCDVHQFLAALDAARRD